MHIKLYNSDRNKLIAEDGFTLVELVLTIGIIAILVLIAIANYYDASINTANQTHFANIRILKGAVHMALNDHGFCAFDNSNPEEPVWHKNSPSDSGDYPCWTDYLQKWPSVPPSSDYSGDYEIYLEYPGPKVIVITK